ncbi:MAG: DUF1598 domain-containing protein [Planctomycetia bacterium]|nr:DUF1598 domain-containing protein [Planctomycetia bacterium]
MHTTLNSSRICRVIMAVATAFAPMANGTAFAQVGAAQAAGVLVDANGVLRTKAVADPGLSQERRKAAVATLPGDLQKRVPLRKVALSRLEAALATHAADGRGIPDSIEKLAGLTRVHYVFVYPAEGDTPGEIVIAGPAEPWMTDAAGRVVGVETGSPTVLLEDLATAIRAFAPGQPQDRLVGCSIDPTKEGLAAMQDFLRKTGRLNPQGGADQIVAGMKEALGPQTVSVQGVPAATHFAQVMVEADYRMKLIGIGLEQPPVKMPTWIDLASAGAVAANALQRWYFVPDYECVKIAEDDLAIELVGQGVKLCGADEVVRADGTRLSATRADKPSKTFTEAFTRDYTKIAAKSPVYAQLRTMIDLVVAAAYLQEHDGYGKAAWAAETLRDEKAYPIERLTPPAQAETAIHAVWRNNRLLTPIGGGVTAHPRMALEAPNLIMDEKGEVAAARTAAKDLPAEGWYWD